MERLLKIEYLPLSSLRPAKKNPKQHDLETLDRSFERFGYVSPIILDERTKRVVAGHGRMDALQAAQKAGQAPPGRVRVQDGDWLVPVVKGYRSKDDQEASAYLLADNQLAMLRGFDDSELKEFLDDLQDFSGTGFEGYEGEKQIVEDDPSPLIDNAAELQKKWKTQLGQLWEIGPHRLLCGDCTKEEDVHRLMGKERAVLFETDPPYLVAYDGTNHPHKWNDTEEIKRRKNKDWHDKYTDVDSPELGKALYNAFVGMALKQAIRENAAWYCWHASRNQALLEEVWEKHGAFVHQQIIWAKDRPILTRSWYMWQHEPCFFGWVKGNKPQRASKDYPPTVWRFPTAAPGETTDHPTQKPVELFAIPMRQHTRPDDLCYEPFSGSGTQFVAAQQLERRCFGLELQPAFVAVALERLANLGMKPRLAK
ncbi:MAG: hypothetical protein A3H94_03095 [Acidobacteria bacterium RIFCSPLOWO2_02_FULL_60_20]|nr:MAG: hypothetical protein A3H94_03095 [Acidobacteria bacterium RIFCSPLOWO2_02_FULL_60_20]